MPVHLPCHSRRQFLSAMGAGIVTCSLHAADSEIQHDIVYLLNDTHIGEKHPPNSPVPTHLRMVVSELAEFDSPPAAVIINGDLALKDGQPGDYRRLGELLAPLRDRVDVHLTLGNHDDRKVFHEVLTDQRAENSPVESRFVSVVRTQHANFFLLDSLQVTMVTPGTLGEVQRNWLAAALDEHASKPAIIVAHHNPRLGGDPNHFPGGLTDSEELWNLLSSRPNVKAYIHGHIHDRSLADHRGIHIINTPATSYVADPKKSTTGWTIAHLTPEGMTLTTRTTDPDHPWHGQTARLRWRDG